MKKLILMALMLAPVSLFAQKFGQFSSADIIQAMPEYTKAMTELQTLQKQYEDELKYLQEECDKKIAEYEAQEATLPDNIKQRRQQEIIELQNKGQQFFNDCQMNLQRISGEKMQEIQEKVLKAVQDVGTEGGYVCIFDNADATIPYISATLCTNVTDAVKAKLGIK